MATYTTSHDGKRVSLTWSGDDHRDFESIALYFEAETALTIAGHLLEHASAVSARQHRSVSEHLDRDRGGDAESVYTIGGEGDQVRLGWAYAGRGGANVLSVDLTLPHAAARTIAEQLGKHARSVLAQRPRIVDKEFERNREGAITHVREIHHAAGTRS